MLENFVFDLKKNKKIIIKYKKNMLLIKLYGLS